MIPRMTVARQILVAVTLLAAILHLGHEGFQQCQIRREIRQLLNEIDGARHRRDAGRITFQAELFSTLRPGVGHRRSPTSLTESGSTPRVLSADYAPERGEGER